MSRSEVRRQPPVVLVTGAAHGIGQAIAQRLADTGYRLALNDLNGAALSRALDRLQGTAGQVTGIEGDVGDPNAVQAMVDRTMEQFGRVDGLVNNAGIGGIGKTIVELGFEEWNEMLRVDLTSTFLLCRAVLPQMISRKRGRIVNISSVTALMGVAGSTHYAAAKAGIIGFEKMAFKIKMLNAVYF